jgi:hypothetical protein
MKNFRNNYGLSYLILMKKKLLLGNHNHKIKQKIKQKKDIS